jgi:hypothetical protein
MYSDTSLPNPRINSDSACIAFHSLSVFRFLGSAQHLGAGAATWLPPLTEGSTEALSRVIEVAGDPGCAGRREVGPLETSQTSDARR